MNYGCRGLLLVVLWGVFGGPAFFGGGSSLLGQDQPMRIEIDARDLPRRLVTATLEVPISASEEVREVPLWYPKWVPGSHGPGGPIANVAGLVFSDANGETLQWRRSPGEVYRVQVMVPAKVDLIRAQIRYISNQPTTNSFGHDTFGSPAVGIISPGTILLYAEGASIEKQMIESTLLLPRDWQAATALSRAKHDSENDTYTYSATSLRNFVDSPIMCGVNYRSYDLAVDSPVTVAAHALHVFSESPAAVELDGSVLERLKKMVQQTAILTGSQPFDRFDILLAATDNLPANGLEHSRSTLNVLPIASLRSAGSLKGWSRLLIPHEYLHTWCGKYRRPAEMVFDNFHTAKGTDLLWVYEGLTQYLGELIEARCGLMSKDEFRDRLGVELRNAMHQQNRLWRPLVDTAAASHVLRDSSLSWPKVRGSQDYYMEGMLFWLEVDAILRTRTNGEKSLDDFCQVFFAAPEATATKLTCIPKPFTRDEIVGILGTMVEYDWDGLIKRRVEYVRDGYPVDVAELLGYQFKEVAKRPNIPSNTFRFPSGIDHYDTLGLMLGSDGSIADVRLDSPADQAKLGPGMKIIGIEDKKWDRDLLEQAVNRSANSPAINLLVVDAELLKPVQLQYYAGPKYWSLVRDEGSVDLLEKILESR